MEVLLLLAVSVIATVIGIVKVILESHRPLVARVWEVRHLYHPIAIYFSYTFFHAAFHKDRLLVHNDFSCKSGKGEESVSKQSNS